jgi:ATP/maltotriose-dependent transcriptional regulator MalT
LGGDSDVATQVLGLQVRAKLLARRGDHASALSLAEEADHLARATEAPVEQGDAALTLAEVLHLAGNRARAEQETQRAIKHYERKGATACVARAHDLAATWRQSIRPGHTGGTAGT